MSRPVVLGGPSGEVATVPGYGHLLYYGTTVPVAGSLGYAHGCVFIKTSGNSESDGVYANSGDEDNAGFVVHGSGATYPEGVHDIAATLTILRQRTTLGSGVPAAYLTSQFSKPGGYLRGADMFGTVLRFATSVTDALIKTELYGTSTVSKYWNDNNTSGDTTKRASLCPMISDLTVDGKAELEAHPYSIAGVHGVSHPFRADGLRVESSGFFGERLRFFQIPGTAVVINGGSYATQSGHFGIYEHLINQLQNVSVIQAIDGISVGAADTQLTNINVAEIADDGIVMNGADASLANSHVWGTDRGLTFSARGEANNVYIEASRIGVEIESTASGTRINGLNIGPATTWERCAKISGSGSKLLNLYGTVKAEDGTYTDIVGVEIPTAVVNVTVQGEIVVNGASDGVKMGGSRHKIELQGGWNGTNSATWVRASENLAGCEVNLKGTIGGGTALDLSATTLNSVDGAGNVFDLNVGISGAAVRVLYPGGGTTFNLTTGNRVFINGVLQV